MILAITLGKILYWLSLVIIFIGGVFLGYALCERDNEKTKSKVAKMTWSETLRKYQEGKRD